MTITCPEVTVGRQNTNEKEKLSEKERISDTTGTEAADAEAATAEAVNAEAVTEETANAGKANAEAVLVFSSPHYEWVKVDGTEYLPDNAEESGRETSVFTIPVLLEEEMRISALTTAMSEPHEIEYTIFISLDEEKQDHGKQDREEANDEEPNDEEPNDEEPIADEESISGRGRPESSAAPEIPGLTFVSEKELAYAEAFTVYSYKNDKAGDSSGESFFRLINVFGNGGARYLLVPEGAEVPEELQKALRGTKNPSIKSTAKKSGSGPDDPCTDPAADVSSVGKITVLQAPLDNLYVAATSSMALFDAAGAIDRVRLTGTDVKGWYIDAPKQALENGTMVYAGKYSAPDYELLAVSGCGLAVESMMILHTPEVKEKLEELGIPVFIDTSSSEPHPMGRTEWVRLYGILTGHEAEADAFFEKQRKTFAESESYTDTGKTAAFFSITSSGNVVVRAADDYIPRMIGLAGGQYIFTDLTKGTGNSASVRLSMEDFYNTAKDTDYLIYNATIEQPVGSIRELCSKFTLLSEFKAVQEGHVWQVRGSLYQSPDIAAELIRDIRFMLTEENDSQMTFLESVSD